MTTPDPSLLVAVPTLGDVYQLRLTLADVRPRVWRRVLVPGYITLHQLHDVLQVTFLWADEHHHRFTVDDTSYGEPDTDHEQGVLDERGVCLDDVVANTTSLVYLYDFSDEWRVNVEIEAAAMPFAETSIACLEGENAGPPEQFGGLARYATFVEMFQDPDYSEFDDYRDVLGRPFNPTWFDRELVNEVLAHL